MLVHPRDCTFIFAKINFKIISSIGGDVVFQCRDEGPLRAAVRWIKEGGRPLKPGSVDRKGRLEMTKVSVSIVYRRRTLLFNTQQITQSYM